MSEENYCRKDDCDGELVFGPESDDMPEGLAWVECEECGQLYEYDLEVEELRVDIV